MSLSSLQKFQIIEQALQQPINEREAFVRDQCRGNEDLFADIQALVEHAELAATEGFLAEPGKAAEQLVSISALQDSLDATEAIPLDMDELLSRVEASRIASSEKINQWWNELPDEWRTKPTSELITQLVVEGMLTAYQADLLVNHPETRLVLGNYEILEHIADGGMGHVYQARHRLMNRIVAIKLVAQNLLDSSSAIRRFRREFETAAKLNHPNIVQAFDADEVDGTLLLAMEYVDGIDLADMVKRLGPIPLEQALEYVLQAAKGLSFAHKNHVVHRDVKPSNMLVDHENLVKILDVGLARSNAPVSERFSQTSDDITKSSQMFGTVDFLAPEQADNPKTADQRADIYSLGCSLFFLLTARPIYEAETLYGKIVAHREAPIPALADQRDDIPIALDELFRSMVAKSPEDRIETTDAVVSRLRRILDELPANEDFEWEFGSSLGNTKSDVSTVVNRGSTLKQPTVRESTAHNAKSRFSRLIAMLTMFVLGLIVASFAMKSQSNDGIVAVTLDEGIQPDDVSVFVDGNKVTPQRHEQTLSLRLRPDKHQLRVEMAGGMTLIPETEFSLTTNQVVGLHGRLSNRPLVVSIRPAREDPPIYLSAIDGGGRSVSIDATQIGHNESFLFHVLTKSDNVWVGRLQTGRGFYLTVFGGVGFGINAANRDFFKATPFSVEWIDIDSGKAFLRTTNGLYVSWVSPSLSVRQRTEEEVDDSEHFFIEFKRP